MNYSEIDPLMLFSGTESEPADSGEPLPAAALELPEEDTLNEAEVLQVLEQWSRETRSLRRQYPEFNLARELDNPTFAALAGQPGMALETAYCAVHHRELERRAAEDTARQISRSIQANKLRPEENGASPWPGTTLRLNPGHLTKAQRAEIRRRVETGERIRF